MHKYRIKWGGYEHTIEAANEGEAWARFCVLVAAAYRYPNRHKRTVTLIPPPGQVLDVPGPVSPSTDSAAE